MKPTELRIGNWVKYDSPWGDYATISQINAGGNVKVKIGHENRVSGASKIQPIPLTEEWLKKFGFEYNSGLKHWIKPNSGFYYAIRVGWLIPWMDDNCEVKTPLHHVHQLQNLYHALTGEELKIEK